MDVPLIELFLEELTGEIRKGDVEAERMSAEVERMKAEIERIHQNKTKLQSAAASVRPLLNRREVVITPEQIADLARKYWAERGYVDGGHEEDWLRAEQELLARSHSPIDVEANATRCDSASQAPRDALR